MNKQGKKLLALILALAMSLQWLPALADDPTVTVNGTAATVDAGDQTRVSVYSGEYGIPKDGDIKIEDGYVYVWHADPAPGYWELITDGEGKPVDPAGYTETDLAHGTSVGVWLSDNYQSLTDSETGEYATNPETVTVNVGDVTIESEYNNTGVYAQAEMEEKPMDLAVNAESVTVTVENKNEFDAENPGDSQAYATGVSTYVEQQGEQDTGAAVAVAGDVVVSASSENSGAHATGITEYGYEGSASVEAQNVNVSASGQSRQYEYQYKDESGEVIDTWTNSENTSATGVEARSYWKDESTPDVERKVTVKDVTVTAESKPVESGVSSSSYATGVRESNESAGGTFNVETGKVTVTAKDENESGYADATGIYVDMGSSTGTVTSGDVTAHAEGTNTFATGVNAHSNEKNYYDDKKDEYVSAGPGSTTVTAGNVTATSENGGATGVYANSYSSESQTTVTVGNVEASGSSENGSPFVTGVSEYGNGGQASVEAKNVSAQAKGTAKDNNTPEAIGVNVQIYNNAIEGAERTVKAGDVTATVEANKTEEEYEYSQVYSNGVFTRDYTPGTSVSVEVGNVKSTATNENPEGHATATGINEQVHGGSVSVTAGDVTAAASGTYTNAVGIRGNVESIEKYNEDKEIWETVASGEMSANTGDVTVISENGYASGIDFDIYGQGSTAEIVAGDVAVTSENGRVTGIGMTIYGDESQATVTTGGVTAASTDGNTTGISVGVYNNSETDVTVVGDVTAESEKTSRGIQASATGGSVNIETGSVTVTGSAIATGIQTTSSNNNLTDSEGNIISSEVGSVDITANGDVTATSADGEATGINVVAYKDSETDVVVVGDVTAEGKEKGVGIFVRNDNADVDIVVDGTVSGSTNAIEVLTSQAVNGNVQASMDVADTTLTVWAAEENKDGHVAVAVDRNMVPGNEERPAPIITDTVNEEATKTLEASINYIVKIGTEFLQKMTAAGAKGNTVKVGETTYATANEGEDVNVGVTIDSEKEVLEGVYYNAEDESTLTATKDLKTDEKGGFLMKMLRGGAMLLGLKVHTHVYEYKYNKDATCTADGTETGWCACGKQGDTRTKAGTKLGHSFANYVSNGDATCTADGTKTGTCSRCGATDTVADPGSVLGHSFGAYVSNGDATCTADGTKTATCSRCGATDTVADEGSALGHSFGAYVSDGNATCTTAGTKTATCSRCGATDTVADAKKGHKPGEAVQENYVAAGPGYAGSYDLVVYCTVCEEEISRKQVVIPALPLDVEPPVEPAPATRKVLTYVAVDDDEEVCGVKASEQPVMEDALMIVAENLEQQEYTKISLPAMEEVLSEEQVKALESLPAQEQLILTLCALGYSENEDQLSKDGGALLEEIKDQITIDELLGQFPVTNMTINGKECQTFQIEIVTVKDGVSTFQRFTFFNDEGTWKLYQVETGVYVDVAV